MLTAFIAICLIGTPPEQCQLDTAVGWLVAPERQHHYGSCFSHGQQYAAQSRLVTEETYLKIFCLPPEKLRDENGEWARN